ncbi:hypothetical protein G9A89_011215 [Geosiphon pyriformis]|nr:hypothetical protein G9A89_011215 [Geosiphon pyriformis]
MININKTSHHFKFGLNGFAQTHYLHPTHNFSSAMSTEEIEILRTIYENDLSSSNTYPTRYAITVSGNVDPASASPPISYSHEITTKLNEYSSILQTQIQLLFDIPSGYPSQPINTHVISPLNDHSQSTIQDLKTKLDARAKELAKQEEFAIYELTELCRNWLWEYQSDNFSSDATDIISPDWWVGEWVSSIFDWQIESYSPTKIMQVQFEAERKVIESVKEQCGIVVLIAQARKRLRFNLWDAEKTVIDILKNVADGKISELGVFEIEHKNPKEDPFPVNENTEENLKTCAICFDDFPKSEITMFAPCRHVVCNDCFIQYLTIKISERSVFAIGCPGETKCQVLVDPITIGWMLSCELSTKYYTWLRDSFVQLQQGSAITRFTWCIEPKCNYAISFKPVNGGQPLLYNCNGCKSTWCQMCQAKNGHWPATCKDYDHYSRINHTVQLFPKIVAPIGDISTKACPKCNIQIAKNGGCMHMVCGLCTFEYCWGCGIEWAQRKHSTLYECDKGTYNDIQEFEVFEIDNLQNTPGTFQKKFKQGVIQYNSNMRTKITELKYMLKQLKINHNKGPLFLLKVRVFSLLAQVNSILKFTSMVFFARAEKVTPLVRQAVEICQRVSFGLQAVETIKNKILELERMEGHRGSGSFSKQDLAAEEVEAKTEKAKSDFEVCMDQIAKNVKRLVSALSNLES